MDDPDAIWKPGYDGPTPTVESDTDGSHELSPGLLSEPESPTRPARSRWWFGVGVVLVVVVVVVVVAVVVGLVVALDPIGTGGEPEQDDTADGSVFGAPDDRRLPQSSTELWSVDIELIDDDLDDVGDHWVEVIRRELVVAAVASTVASTVESTVASTVESTVASPATTLVAFDALTGEQRWTFALAARPDDLAVVGAVGDALVVEQAGEPSPTVTWIDMATGEPRSPGEAATKAGQVGVVDALSADSLIPVSGSNFVMTAPGSISGVVVDGDTRRVVWSRNDGVVVDLHPIDGGTLLQVATRGGAGMELVDGLTGETVEHLAMVPGTFQALVVAGDGIVVLRPAVLGTRLVAIGFDGTERWSILGSEPVVVGDRIMARVTTVDGLLRISAYGDVE